MIDREWRRAVAVRKQRICRVVLMFVVEGCGNNVTRRRSVVHLNRGVYLGRLFTLSLRLNNVVLARGVRLALSRAALRLGLVRCGLSFGGGPLCGLLCRLNNKLLLFLTLCLLGLFLEGKSHVGMNS